MATVPKSISTDIEIVFPNEIWIRIISHVPMAQWPSLESINKTIQRNVYDSWKNVLRIKFDEDLAIDRRKIQDDAFEVKTNIFDKLLLRAPNIRSMSGFTIFTNTTDLSFADGNFLNKLSEFKYLESVDLTNVSMASGELVNFLETPAIRRRLKNLKLINCLPDYDSMTWSDENQILTKAFGYIPDLPSLRLEEFHFGGRCECFDFFQTMDVTNLTVLNLIDAPCQADRVGLLIGRCSTRLRHLECNLFFNSDSDYQTLFSAIALCKNLSILKIDRRNFIPATNVNYSDVVNRIIQWSESQSLVEFSFLIDPRFINDQVIGDYLPNLTSLELYVGQRGAPTLTYLLSKTVGLKKLGLYTKPDIDQQIINRDILKILTKTLIDLEDLHLTNPPIYFGSENDLIGLKKLKKLSFESGKTTKNERLTIWLTVFGSKLKSLVLKDFGGDEFPGILISLLEKMPDLRRLGLKNCKIEESYLLPIVLACPNLEEFDLPFYGNIFPKDQIIDRCPKLKRIIGLTDPYCSLKFGKNRSVALSNKFEG